MQPRDVSALPLLEGVDETQLVGNYFDEFDWDGRAADPDQSAEDFLSAL